MADNFAGPIPLFEIEIDDKTSGQLDEFVSTSIDHLKSRDNVQAWFNMNWPTYISLERDRKTILFILESHLPVDLKSKCVLLRVWYNIDLELVNSEVKEEVKQARLHHKEIQNKLNSIFSLLSAFYPAGQIAAYNELKIMKKEKLSSEKKARQAALLSIKSNDSGKFFSPLL